MFYFCSPIQYNVVMDFSIKVKDYSEVCVGSVADLLSQIPISTATITLC